ncbi:hypothetical protein TanjilG_27002 [Lupinus angustifolius]|uniref:Phospholipase A1 n=2 Tax=Lupinus angustifolius TaxID=3871 RepID=A0A4P1QVL4_LUPAN|nr:hypothetical protein TanjilG_27002 [Lupinus angustifolius]
MALDNSVAKKWKELSGQNQWKGLLDPLNIDLRRYIIHYGEMAQATYDGFNTVRASKYCGSCLFKKSEFFDKVELNHGKLYTVTKYLYATSSIPLIPDIFMVKSLSREAWSKESNWIGYVAVATDAGKKVLGRREIVIAWRGTIQSLEWVNDLQFVLLPAPQVFKSTSLVTGLVTDPKVHQGWYNIYTSASARSQFNQTSVREQVTSEVQRLVQLYKNEEISITVTGHSLGGAVATLNAVDIVANGFNKGAPVSAFVFASPGVGDINFKRVVSGYKDLRIFRVENTLDIVPKYPPLGYFNVGEGLIINTQKSQYLKKPGDVVSWHILEPYLHGVAGTQGGGLLIGGGGFKLEVDRDIALVNKQWDVLADEYLVPPLWWTLKHKGVVKQPDGKWKLDENKDDRDEYF